MASGYSTNRLLANVINEARFALLFDWLDIGPKFYGVQVTPDNHYALVYEYIEGAHVGQNYDFGIVLIKTPSLRKAIPRIEEIALILDSLDAETGDPQVRITRSGEVFIVDSELFSLKGLLAPNHKPIEEFEQIAHYIEDVIESRGD